MSMDIEGAGAGAGAGARAGAGAHSSENDSLPLGATGLSNILTRMDMSPAKRHKKANDGEGMGENAVLPKTLDWNTAARAESGDDARSDQATAPRSGFRFGGKVPLPSGQTRRSSASPVRGKLMAAPGLRPFGSSQRLPPPTPAAPARAGMPSFGLFGGAPPSTVRRGSLPAGVGAAESLLSPTPMPLFSFADSDEEFPRGGYDASTPRYGKDEQRQSLPFSDLSTPAGQLSANSSFASSPLTAFADLSTPHATASPRAAHMRTRSLEGTASTAKSMPMPDQSAFDSETLAENSRRRKSWAPLCPDTPLRKTPTSKSADLREKQVLFSEANLPTSCPTSASSTASKDGGEEDMDGARSTHDSPDEARLRLATCEDRVPWPCDATPAADHETQTSTFEFEMLVGSGAFGDVFKAHLMSDTAMWPQGSIFAVKKAKKQFRNEHDRDHVLAEVRNVMAIGEHQNIVRHYAAWQEDGHLYTQMEFCGLGSVKYYADHNTLREDELWGVLADVGRGLAHIHGKGYLHLDLKPENIFLTDDGTLKIGDFGVTVHQGCFEDGNEGDSVYLAPEVLDGGHHVSAAADIFSLGLMLFELGAQKTLPPNGSLWHTLRSEAPSRLTYMAMPEAHKASGFETVVHSMTEYKAERRPALDALLDHPCVGALRDSKARRFECSTGFGKAKGPWGDAIAPSPRSQALYTTYRLGRTESFAREAQAGASASPTAGSSSSSSAPSKPRPLTVGIGGGVDLLPLGLGLADLDEMDVAAGTTPRNAVFTPTPGMFGHVLGPRFSS